MKPFIGLLGWLAALRLPLQSLSKAFLRAAAPSWPRVLAYGLAASMLAACGGGPKVPDWRKDSVNLIEKYKLAELKGENVRAEHYFEQALAAAGSAGRLDETARLHLVRCATRQASLALDPCVGYLETARHQTMSEDEHYLRFLSAQWDELDRRKLPPQYQEFVQAGDPAKTLAAINAIRDPLSRLIAASLAIKREQASDELLTLAADTASEQGWRKPLLVYLKLLEKRAALRDDAAALARLRARIGLVEGSLPPRQ